jgi:DNA-binding LytR/AlgR family response regulator
VRENRPPRVGGQTLGWRREVDAGIDGVIQAIGAERMPTVIFITAYDEYALRAFEVHALDYLLKPMRVEIARGA